MQKMCHKTLNFEIISNAYQMVRCSTAGEFEKQLFQEEHKKSGNVMQ